MALINEKEYRNKENIYNSKADYIAYYCNIEKTDANINELNEIAIELETHNVVLFIPTDDNKVQVYLQGYGPFSFIEDNL